MTFKLKKDNRNATDHEILADLKKIAATLANQILTAEAYSRQGRFSSMTVRRRFGTWNTALKKAKLPVTQFQNISNEDLLDDIKRTARQLKKKTLTKIEYKKHGKYSPDVAILHFGSWNNALEKSALAITKHHNISIESLFANIEKVWLILGRQPYYKEMCAPLSQFSYRTYKDRFGAWHIALEKFVTFMESKTPEPAVPDNLMVACPDLSSGSLSNHMVACPDLSSGSLSNHMVACPDPSGSLSNDSVTVSLSNCDYHKTKRDVSWKLRFLVMKRDKFRCVACGRAPAIDPGIVLHIDHIIPWDKGGESTFENLQTLCSICNIGKSDLCLS